jgi:hypothetical protein
LSLGYPNNPDDIETRAFKSMNFRVRWCGIFDVVNQSADVELSCGCEDGVVSRLEDSGIVTPRADGMYDVFGWKIVSVRWLSMTRLAAVEEFALVPQPWACGFVNGSVHTSSAQALLIGRVDDTVHHQLCHTPSVQDTNHIVQFRTDRCSITFI